jgi:hypothetical protein
MSTILAVGVSQEVRRVSRGAVEVPCRSGLVVDSRNRRAEARK